MTFHKKVFAAVNALNANFGIGLAVAHRLTLAGEGSFTQAPYMMKQRSRKFRIKQFTKKGANFVTVYALRHQVTTKL